MFDVGPAVLGALKALSQPAIDLGNQRAPGYGGHAAVAEDGAMRADRPRTSGVSLFDHQ